MIAATEKFRNRKALVVALAALVVFVTTYMLILPAITLDEEAAENLGGIDVSAGENAADVQEAADVMENAGASEDADANDAQSEDGDADAGNLHAGDLNTDDADGLNADDAEADVVESSEATDEQETAKAASAASISDGGRTYDVTVTYGEEAGVPEDASLEVTEITSKSDQYDKLMSRTEDALGKEAVVAFARFFDIKIVDANGEKVEIEAPVDVKIELTDKDGNSEYSEHAQVVHFADGAKKGDVIEEVGVEGAAVSFLAEGFSAYAIVEGPDSTPIGWHKVESISELTSRGLYIGHPNGFYFMNTTTGDSARMGITKTKPAAEVPQTDKAAKYFFEPAGGENLFYVYCYGNDGTTKQYVYNGGNNSLSFTDEDNKTAFTVEAGGSGVFKIHNGDWYWNMQGGNNGSRFCSYNNANDGNNSLVLWYYSDVEEDPYDLDGASFGLINWNGGAKGKAMMAEESAGALNAKELTVMTKTGNDSDKLFIPKDSNDITMWSFNWISEDQYRLAANAGGSTAYLKVDSDGKLSLVYDESDASLIHVIPGTGAHKGQICLKAGSHTLTYSGKIENGFNTDGETGTEWLYLAKKSELTSDYFLTHSAQKISVSDPEIPYGDKGSKIIIYTRAWNEDLKKYEFFAIDHDGSLVHCYESGDSIEWVGGLLNTMLWDLTEYYDEKTGEPSGYYEFFNQYAEKYLAPQVTDGQILSGKTIGVNLNGRTNGKYYTSILAWDDDFYAYAGLKVENGRIVSCKKSEAMDFYFAIVEETPADDTLHTVPTLDHTQYGITMKIQNFGTRAEMSGFLGNDEGGAVLNTVPNLLSTNLGADGYPTAVKGSGQSLANLFNATKAVNHLFIESTYKASGYYEFDSTQNFASLKGQTSGDFTVYKELGSYDSGGNKNTLKHGQFFPFNDIEAGKFASVNRKNLYSATGQLLPDGDPRKNEQLYLIDKADCYYGVELEASFIQTPNGEDDWGHDIIYEFTGDDDFWLYVNGELVIDLGGIHSALPGTINFKTGIVEQVDGKGKKVTATLREIFESNYKSRNPGASEAEVAEYLAGFFEGDSTVFKTYSTNTMRIFYMERGAGAANLHMRFNLASVKPGTVELSKKLKGVDDSETILAEFPYQIWYDVRTLSNGAGESDTDEDDLKLLKDTGSKHPVLYKDTITPVPYKESLTIDGITYEDVYMLKPGETAEIDFTAIEDQLKENQYIVYKIVECGVNTDVYKSVEVNGEAVSGTAVTGHDNRKDFGIGVASTGARAKVTYSNEVRENALRTLTFSKKLFKEDGTTEIDPEDDSTRFEFRLYLGTEFDQKPALARMHAYHVRDTKGKYCVWNETEKKFESTDMDEYDTMTAEEKESVTFHTSIYGTISKIPVGYTVEVRELLAGTKFGVQERPGDVPDGYSFQKYLYSDDYPEVEPSVCTAAHLSNLPDEGGAKCVTDVTAAGKDPHVDICNLKGFGLRVNKKWSDQDYMSDRDATYFAVFTKTGDALKLVDGTVRQMAYDNDAATQTLYWYFQRLPIAGVAFDDYEIREVTLSEAHPQVDSEGVVTEYGTVTIVEDGATLKLNGTQKGESRPSAFDYTVLYKKGTKTDNDNVRVDTVTNNRPGIVLRKTDWNGDPLKGATFRLTRGDDEIGTFTSDKNGEITIAFLSDDVDYTLTETETPQAFHGPEGAMTIRLSNGTVTVSGVSEDWYSLEQGSAKTPTLTIKNRSYTFRVVKKDKGTGKGLQGVKFDLYQKKIVDDHAQYVPMTDYTGMTTGEDGMLAELTEDLPAGEYELRETEAKAGYEALSSYIRFTVSKTGTVELGTCPDGVELKTSDGENGALSYELEILNPELKQVSFMKIDDAGVPLAGATFDLHKDANGKPGETLYSDLTSDENGMLRKNGQGDQDDQEDLAKFTLPSGTYYLVETEAPSGYNMKESPVVINITRGVDTEDAAFGAVKSLNGISYNEGTDLSRDGRGIRFSATDNLYTLQITNSAGVVLPAAGGMGTTRIYLLGALLMLLAGAGLAARRRGVL